MSTDWRTCSLASNAGPKLTRSISLIGFRLVSLRTSIVRACLDFDIQRNLLASLRVGPHKKHLRLRADFRRRNRTAQERRIRCCMIVPFEDHVAPLDACLVGRSALAHLSDVYAFPQLEPELLANVVRHVPRLDAQPSAFHLAVLTQF